MVLYCSWNSFYEANDGVILCRGRMAWCGITGEMDKVEWRDADGGRNDKVDPRDKRRDYLSSNHICISYFVHVINYIMWNIFDFFVFMFQNLNYFLI